MEEAKQIKKKLAAMQNAQFEPVLGAARELANEACPTTSHYFTIATADILLRAFIHASFGDKTEASLVNSFKITKAIAENMPAIHMDTMERAVGERKALTAAMAYLLSSGDKK